MARSKTGRDVRNHWGDQYATSTPPRSTVPERCSHETVQPVEKSSDTASGSSRCPRPRPDAHIGSNTSIAPRNVSRTDAPSLQRPIRPRRSGMTLIHQAAIPTNSHAPGRRNLVVKRGSGAEDHHAAGRHKPRNPGAGRPTLSRDPSRPSHPMGGVRAQCPPPHSHLSAVEFPIRNDQVNTFTAETRTNPPHFQNEPEPPLRKPFSVEFAWK